MDSDSGGSTVLLDLDLICYDLQRRFYTQMSYDVTNKLFAVSQCSADVLQWCGKHVPAINILLSDVSHRNDAQEPKEQVFINEANKAYQVRAGFMLDSFDKLNIPELCSPERILIEAYSIGNILAPRLFTLPDEVNERAYRWKKLLSVSLESCYLERRVFDELCPDTLTTLRLHNTYIDPVPKLADLVARFGNLTYLHLHVFNMVITGEDLQAFLAVQQRRRILHTLFVKNKIEDDLNDLNTLAGIFEILMENKGAAKLSFCEILHWDSIGMSEMLETPPSYVCCIIPDCNFIELFPSTLYNRS